MRICLTASIGSPYCGVSLAIGGCPSLPVLNNSLYKEPYSSLQHPFWIRISITICLNIPPPGPANASTSDTVTGYPTFSKASMLFFTADCIDSRIGRQYASIFRCPASSRPYPKICTCFLLTGSIQEISMPRETGYPVSNAASFTSEAPEKVS